MTRGDIGAAFCFLLLVVMVVGALIALRGDVRGAALAKTERKGRAANPRDGYAPRTAGPSCGPVEPTPPEFLGHQAHPVPRTFHIRDGASGERFETVPLAALSACQEELARERTLVDYRQALAEGAEGELARVRQEAKIEVVSAEDRALTARAARDELARAILAPDGVEAIRLARAALSSEATKGGAE